MSDEKDVKLSLPDKHLESQNEFTPHMEPLPSEKANAVSELGDEDHIKHLTRKLLWKLDTR
jgi:hypothetical protein